MGTPVCGASWARTLRSRALRTAVSSPGGKRHQAGPPASAFTARQSGASAVFSRMRYLGSPSQVSANRSMARQRSTSGSATFWPEISRRVAGAKCNAGSRRKPAISSTQIKWKAGESTRGKDCRASSAVSKQRLRAGAQSGPQDCALRRRRVRGRCAQGHLGRK